MFSGELSFTICKCLYISNEEYGQLFWVAPCSIRMWMQHIRGCISQSRIHTFFVGSRSSLMHIECMSVYIMREKKILKSKLLVLFSVGDSNLAFSPFTTGRSWTVPLALWGRSCLSHWTYFFASSCQVEYSNLEYVQHQVPGESEVISSLPPLVIRSVVSAMATAFLNLSCFFKVK